jgi:DNA-binding NarL/FixJ family response regulator
MLIVRAIEILERMRDGKEPVTGKILTSEGPWQSAEVVRALYTVLAALPAEAREEPDEETPPPASTKPRLARAGKPWTDEEDRCLAVAFDEGRAVPEIARVLDRSRKAVRLRLVKLGRIAAEDAPAGRRRREPAIASTG